jgi:hypothetical protein
MAFPKISKSARWKIALAVLLASLVSGVVWKWPEIETWLFPPPPVIITPQLACAEVQGRSIYYNTIAQPWLERLRPDLLAAEDRDPASSRRRAFVQATQNPKLFRQLDRQFRFDTLVLVGEPSNYQRLLDHLIDPEPEKRDFRLVYLDHWACIFKRDAARVWQPTDIGPVRGRLGKMRSRDQATFLAMAAGKLLALRMPDVAKRWLDEAQSLDSRSLDVLGGLAGYKISIGRWIEAEALADRALEKEPVFIPALAAKISAMRATKHHKDAFIFSKRLNDLLPEEPVRLWQHAQLAHEAQENVAEIAALTRLVAMAKEDGRPSAEYEFRLGEAHAFEAINNAEHARAALEHLRNAIADPLLPAQQRKFAEERIAIIRERTGLK